MRKMREMYLGDGPAWRISGPNSVPIDTLYLEDADIDLTSNNCKGQLTT